MAYEPTVWKSGDVVTSAKLNKIEQGIANAGGGGALVVNAVDATLNKTWQEIHDAAPLVWFEEDGGYTPLAACFSEDGDYICVFNEVSDVIIPRTYLTDSADGYPVFQQD